MKKIIPLFFTFLFLIINTANADNEEYFNEIAYSIVACYENVGYLDDYYGDMAQCGDEYYLDELTTYNTSIQTNLLKYNKIEGFEEYPLAGRYEGEVSFFDFERNYNCYFQLDIKQTEEIAISIRDFTCTYVEEDNDNW